MLLKEALCEVEYDDSLAVWFYPNSQGLVSLGFPAKIAGLIQPEPDWLWVCSGTQPYDKFCDYCDRLNQNLSEMPRDFLEDFVEEINAVHYA